jgi:ParB family chromosome partitioning protein
VNVEEIPIAKIRIGDRLRAIDEDYAQLIAESMEEDGQRTPIEVRKIGRQSGIYGLIAGAHRLRAKQLLGSETIFAVILEADDMVARRLEIEENLRRRELTPLDRAVFLAELKAIHDEMYPETAHGGDPKTRQNNKLDRMAKLGHLVPTFTEAQRERVGLSPRAIRRALALNDHIRPDVRATISTTWLANSQTQLEALSRKTPDEQKAVAQFIAENPESKIRIVEDILRTVQQRPKKAAPGIYDKFLLLWAKATNDEKKAILAYVSAPSALRRKGGA